MLEEVELNLQTASENLLERGRNRWRFSGRWRIVFLKHWGSFLVMMNHGQQEGTLCCSKFQLEENLPLGKQGKRI